MSRGPGHVERAIEAAFSENPLQRFYVEDLCRIVYPDHRQVSDKKRIHQRRSVLRAATIVAKRMGWEHREDASGNPELFVGRRVYFETEQGKKALLERIRAAKGHDPQPPPEPTPRELAAKARREELARLRAELPETLAKERDELLARKERNEIEREEIDAGLEALRLRAFHMSQTPQDEWIV